MGVLYLKGKGVKRDIKAASKHLVNAANAGHPKAFYQLAKLFQKGMGVPKDLAMVSLFYFLFKFIELIEEWIAWTTTHIVIYIEIYACK